MRVHYVLLLAASAFFASAEADAVATDSALGASTADRLHIAEKNAVSVSRSLRATAVATEATGFTGWIKKYIASYQKPLHVKLKEWKDEGRSVEYVVKKLKLSKKTAATSSKGSSFHEWQNFDDLYNALTDAMSYTKGKLYENVQSKLVEEWFKANYATFDLKNGLTAMKKQMNPNVWQSHADVLIRVSLNNGHKDLDLARMLEEATLKDGEKLLAEKLQLSLFEIWAKDTYSFHLHDTMNTIDQNIWLKYVEHLMGMKRKSSQLTDIVQKPDDDMLKALVNAATRAEYHERGDEQLIKRWVQKKLRPEDVSWVLGAKVLEEGSQEQKFLTAYKEAFDKEQKSALEAAQYHQPWMAALKENLAL